MLAVNSDQLKGFAAGMINLANILLGVTLVTPIFGSARFTPVELMGVGAAAAVVLYAAAMDILGEVG